LAVAADCFLCRPALHDAVLDGLATPPSGLCEGGATPKRSDSRSVCAILCRIRLPTETRPVRAR
jgi:hypothetical protein